MDIKSLAELLKVKLYKFGEKKIFLIGNYLMKVPRN